MKALTILILLFNLIATNLLSQQCGYANYYLFILHVHEKASTTKVPNLKMYLVDEQGQPVLDSVLYYKDQRWRYKSDTLFFCEHELLKKEAATSPFFRQKYFNLGDYYVVAFHLDTTVLKDPQSFPIFKVKIEADSDDGPNETMIMHLPLQKAVGICNNGITGDFPLVKPVQTLDGKKFEPIDIVLNQPQEAALVETPKDKLHYAVRFYDQIMSSPEEAKDGYLLNRAKIYDTQTGQIHQEIYIPRITRFPWKEGENNVKFADFYNRGITAAKDFSVMIESWKDLELQCYRQKWNYYIFNTTTKQYELDTILSNYDDVLYDETLMTMRWYDFEATGKSRITNTYQLENKKWVLIDKKEAFFNPPPKIQHSTFIVVNEKEHILPVKAVIGTNAKVMVKDTFWLYNSCDDTLYITKVESAVKDFFSINPTLLPKQRTPLVFNGFLTNNIYDLHHNRFFCGLTLTDGSGLGLNIIIPTVSNNAIVYYRADSTVHYAVGNHPKARFSTVVYTYPSGHLSVKGTIVDKDTSLKVGNWFYFIEGSIKSDDVLFSRYISLSALGDTDDSEHNRFKVKVLEKGIWKAPIADYDNNKVIFYITRKTDSIVAYTDTTSYGFTLSYKKLSMYTNKEFYLLKPNERTLKIRYQEIPFEVVENQYALILNYSYLKDDEKTDYELTDDYIAALQEQYPGISTFGINKNRRGINLQNLAYKTRGKVLRQLESDTNVALVCQLFYTNRNQKKMDYCDNKVFADINIDTEYPEKFRRKARRLGYSSIETDAGYNFFCLTYPSKVIDERFFRTFDRLTKKRLVFGAFFNPYFEH